MAIAATPAAAIGGPCQQWEAPEKIGTLDRALLPEASGVAVTPAHSGRLYFNNDSGDGPYFYVSDVHGGSIQRVAVIGFVPQDVEDIAVGPCAGATTCLYLGDIGDNALRRATVEFVQIAERDTYPDELTPLRTVAARYPDGAHNAEGFAIHPDGDLYVMTKESDPTTKASGPARLYRLTAQQLAADAGEVQTFEYVTSLDLPRYIALELPRFVRDLYDNQVATALDISADGSHTMVLTYRQAFEWNHDLAQPVDPARPLEQGRDFTVTPIEPLPQAEAVAYLSGSDAIVYTSETAATGADAALYRQACALR